VCAHMQTRARKVLWQSCNLVFVLLQDVLPFGEAPNPVVAQVCWGVMAGDAPLL